MRDFRELQVWAKSHALTLAVYHDTANFPKEERYGLTSQIRRCCASIPANIAEGCGKRSNPEYHRFLQVASGSASELDYHLLLSRDLHFLSTAQYDKLFAALIEVRRMLSSLMVKVGGRFEAAPANY